MSTPTELPDPLPKTPATDSPATDSPEASGDGAVPRELPGVVLAQRVRCGKPGCRCASGDDRHGPYYYRFWRERGRLRKAYVRPSVLAATRVACARRQARERRQREDRRAVRALLAEFREAAREVERALDLWRRPAA